MKADFHVQTPSRSYPVFVDSSFPQEDLENLFQANQTERVFLIVDENVNRLHGEQIRSIAGSRLSAEDIFRVPAGESSKGYDQWKSIIDFLLNRQARRNSTVLVAGGGVTGDLGGFAVSTALRGLPLIHIPTTLLAMVDSSIGGKTGINHTVGKNLIGTFYQPTAIFMNTSFLSTLPDREWVNGLSEILKYGAIRDVSIFTQCEELFLNRKASHDAPGMTDLIRKCARIKADVVAEDEMESGLRMILNFGHTFAHALENLGGYQTISHGEAVYAGMIAAASLSRKQGAQLDLQILKAFRHLYQYNSEIFSWTTDERVKSMYHDKKRSSEWLKLVLLQDWSKPYVTEIRDTNSIADAWQYAFDLLSPDTPE